MATLLQKNDSQEKILKEISAQNNKVSTRVEI
jgi:hypothetical protein